MRKADWALLAVSLLWGGTFVVVKEALSGVSTLLFLALRFTLAAATLALVLRNRLDEESGKGWGLPGDWLGGLACSVPLFLGYALQTAGLRLTTSSRSAFLTGLYIVLVPLLAALVHQGRPRLAELLGILLACGGTALLTSGGSGWQPGPGQLNLGDTLTLFCALAFAGHILAVAHYSRRMRFERLALYQIAGVAAFSWLALLPMETPRLEWSAGVGWAIAATALVATTLTFLVYTWAQQRTTATRAALIFATEPIFAGLVAWKWAGERWTWGGAAGAALILSGIVLAEVKPGGAKPHQQN